MIVGQKISGCKGLGGGAPGEGLSSRVPCGGPVQGLDEGVPSGGQVRRVGIWVNVRAEECHIKVDMEGYWAETKARSTGQRLGRRSAR